MFLYPFFDEEYFKVDLSISYKLTYDCLTVIVFLNSNIFPLNFLSFFQEFINTNLWVEEHSEYLSKFVAIHLTKLEFLEVIERTLESGLIAIDGYNLKIFTSIKSYWF